MYVNSYIVTIMVDNVVEGYIKMEKGKLKVKRHLNQINFYL